ncbi:MAG: tetratricopeptide repeat protein [Acidobacteria bacterium]|nr:tetratricopeptide repeat protein [Acidobacteriota bacterium]
MKNTFLTTILILIAFSLSMVLMGQEAANTGADNEKLVEAAKLLKEEKFQDAKVLLDELLTVDNPEQAVFDNLCYADYSLKLYDDTMKAAELGLKKYPNNLILKKFKAKALFSKGEKGDAIDLLEEVSEADEKDVETWTLLTIYNFHDRDFSDCIDAAENTIELDPNSIIAYNYMGFSFIAKKKWDKAIKAFDKALEIDPKDKMAAKGKAQAIGLQKQERNSRTIQETGESRETRP